MATELPDEFDCREFMAATGRLAGTIAAARLRRIAPPYRAQDEVAVELQWRRGEGREIEVGGTLDTVLEAQCQRCLTWYALPIRARVDVVAVADLTAAHDDETDCVGLADGKLQLLELIEDELLLNCPMVPVHDSGSCAGDDAAALAQAERRQLPFASLADLMKRRP